METKITIKDLKLQSNEDLAFFRLFDFKQNSLFNHSPLARQLNLIISVSDPHKLLRYAQHSARFYQVAKSEALKNHWQKMLKENISEDLHPFDAILHKHCEEMSSLAKEENNSKLADEYAKLAHQYYSLSAKNCLNSGASA